MDAVSVRRQTAPAPHAPPRWRFSACVGEDPHAVARRSLHRLQEHTPLPFSTSAWTPSGEHVLAAASGAPVGVAVASVQDLPSQLEPHWANTQDSVLERRGIIPGALWLLKRAANGSRGVAPANGLRACRIIPLPHTGGEVLLQHPSGWRGRGIAWWQSGALLALVWQVD